MRSELLCCPMDQSIDLIDLTTVPVLVVRTSQMHSKHHALCVIHMKDIHMHIAGWQDMAVSS